MYVDSIDLFVIYPITMIQRKYETLGQVVGKWYLMSTLSHSLWVVSWLYISILFQSVDTDPKHAKNSALPQSHLFCYLFPLFTIWDYRSYVDTITFVMNNW